MHRNVEVLIGRLATDLGMLSRFSKRPREALREQALELTEVELEALAATSPDALQAFSARLDSRIRKASLEAETRPTEEAKTTRPKARSRKGKSR